MDVESALWQLEGVVGGHITTPREVYPFSITIFTLLWRSSTYILARSGRIRDKSLLVRLGEKGVNPGSLCLFAPILRQVDHSLLARPLSPTGRRRHIYQKICPLDLLSFPRPCPCPQPAAISAEPHPDEPFSLITLYRL